MVRHIVICGGGVIGSSIAYQLSKRKTDDFTITVVEAASSVASGASGKAGGFLARDWCDGQPTQVLARKSFEMHQQIAEELDGKEKYGYRRLDTLSVSVGSGKRKKDVVQSLIDWIDVSNSEVGEMGTKENTGQVHPFFYSNAMMDAAVHNGATLHLNTKVNGLVFDGNKIIGVSIGEEGKTIQADQVVIAMGPWTGSSSSWFKGFDIPIRGSRAHSIVFKPQSGVVYDHALFCHVKVGNKQMDPEVYPRPNGEVYVCGDVDGEALPEGSVGVKVEKNYIETLKEAAYKVVPHLRNVEIQAEQACYLPISGGEGYPLIGKLPNVENGYIASGHSCWGILNSPATGLAMAELLLDGKSSIDISPFDPVKLVKNK